MRLLITSCLVALFSLSAQAYERNITIEADIKADGISKSVWAAYKVKLITNGYSDCKMVYGIIELDCHVSVTDADSIRDAKTTVKMDSANFRVLAWAAAKNKDISDELENQFNRNIRDYSLNNDTMVSKVAIEFRLFEDIQQENLFFSRDYRSVSRIRVTQH